MKRARVAYQGQLLEAMPLGEHLRLSDGRVVAAEAVSWLPPIVPGTIFAVGLNYADHAREIAVAPGQSEPLVFLKGPNSLAGHQARTRRPADAAYMHFECELAVVIGRPARSVPPECAYDYVRGYTVANDYAIRDYLENYYRPNLRVKNRDGATPLGPWLVDAGDIADPMNLALSTTVNGRTVQTGSTRDMVHDIAHLISFLSGFLTLLPGDLILTGTPDGVANVNPGDEVVTEIEQVGRLVNYLVGDDLYGTEV